MTVTITLLRRGWPEVTVGFRKKSRRPPHFWPRSPPRPQLRALQRPGRDQAQAIPPIVHGEGSESITFSETTVRMRGNVAIVNGKCDSHRRGS
jgi:hypothetical protein